MKLDDIQPNKVYLDPKSCKQKHKPCLRYFNSCKCVFCGREAKRHRTRRIKAGTHLVGEDRYCSRCGDPLPVNTRAKLCFECYKTRPQWGRGAAFVCVEGPVEFKGSRFRKEEVYATAKLGFWDSGMIFEEYRDRAYVQAWAVENDPQELIPIRGHVERGFD